MVADLLGGARLNRVTLLVLRSGCYLTHDSGTYRSAFRRLLERTPEAQSLGTGLQPALEVWAQVQSRPEPTRAILTLGKRDTSYDDCFPEPIWWHRPGGRGGPLPVGDGHRVVALNDQHAYLDLPEARSEEHTSELQSLMRISYAVCCLKKKTKLNSHPCTQSHLTCLI